jgi:hypothetical protein
MVKDIFFQNFKDNIFEQLNRTKQTYNRGGTSCNFECNCRRKNACPKHGVNKVIPYHVACHKDWTCKNGMKVHLERVIFSKCHIWAHQTIAQRRECTIRNCVHQYRTTLQLKLKKNSYTTIMQLSFWRYWELINKLSCQKII